MNSINSAIQPANTTAVLVGSETGTIVRKIEAFNNSSASLAYLKLYNSPQGTAPTNSDTPLARYMIEKEASVSVDIEGLLFTQGCWYRVTRNLADNDATAVGANEVIVNIYR